MKYISNLSQKRENHGHLQPRDTKQGAIAFRSHTIIKTLDYSKLYHGYRLYIVSVMQSDTIIYGKYENLSYSNRKEQQSNMRKKCKMTLNSNTCS